MIELENGERSLAHTITELTFQVDTLQSSLKETVEKKEPYSTFSMSQISHELVKAAGGAAQISLNEKKAELQEKIKYRTDMQAEIESMKKTIVLRPQQMLNLLRTKNELEKVNQIKVYPAEKKSPKHEHK